MTDEPTTQGPYYPNPTVEQLLDFEEAHPQLTGKTEQIRIAFGVSPTRYYVLLNRAIDDPASVTHNPITTHRLQRQREDRRARRDSRSTNH